MTSYLQHYFCRRVNSMSSSKFKYTAMTDEGESGAAAKAVSKSQEQLIDVQILELDYGATEPVCHPNNHRNHALRATACCCPCGMRALKYSNQVNPKMRAGDVEGAKEASEKALHYSHLSMLTGLFMYGIIGLMLFCILLILVFVAIDAARGLHP